MQISRTKLVYVTYGWCTLYPYQVSLWWHDWFLRYRNCLFCTYTDPVTYIKVKGHQQWYCCLELNGGYNQTKFDLARYHSLWEKTNVKFLDTDGRTDGRPDGPARQTNTDHYIDSHFFSVSQKDRQTHAHKHKRHTYTHTCSQTDRHMQRERGRQTGRHPHTQTEKQSV